MQCTIDCGRYRIAKLVHSWATRGCLLLPTKASPSQMTQQSQIVSSSCQATSQWGWWIQDRPAQDAGLLLIQDTFLSASMSLYSQLHICRQMCIVKIVQCQAWCPLTWLDNEMCRMSAHKKISLPLAKATMVFVRADGRCIYIREPLIRTVSQSRLYTSYRDWSEINSKSWKIQTLERMQWVFCTNYL